jgi:UDP-2,4-diacetamido-2,4,6-trideoxy-beta-L-altropyranose hydrolase
MTMKSGILLIRADAAVAIGTGHVMRCLALAQAWQDAGGSANLVTAELPEPLAPVVTDKGVSLIRIESVPGSAADAAETVDQARRLRADWVVVDGERFGSDFLDTIKAAGFQVLLIDDFAERKSVQVDLIANPNLDEDEGNYRKKGAAGRLLIGPSYTLLRREFKRQKTAGGGNGGSTRATGNRVLVTLGGSDPENLTPKIAAALASAADLRVTVVAGHGYDKVAELRKLKANNVELVFNSSDMAQFMTDSDIAIIAAGGTLWEVLSMQCVVLSYSRNTVQSRVVAELAKRGAVVDMGETPYFDAKKLVRAVMELVDSQATRQRMATLGQSLVDGLGATRVVEAMIGQGMAG